MKFSDHFKIKRNAWAIIADFANLFAHLYKQKENTSCISDSDGAPVNIEFIIYVFGELGKPNQNQLI